jgi:hypothetical protein
MNRAPFACLLLFACSDEPADGAGGSETGDDTIIIGPDEDDDTDTEGDTDTGPVDADGDGHDDTIDCDDTDAAVNPDATEVWNGVDDDCDGRRDGDGTYRGELAARATAVYEGEDYRFDLVCTAAMERDGADFTLVVTCPTDTEDEMAQLLLGATLVLSVEEDLDERDAPYEEWQGRGVMRSSDGWDTWLDAELSWVAFEGVAFSADRNAASLAVTASGTLTWQPPDE